jgi:PBSX family phage portal protein
VSDDENREMARTFGGGRRQSAWATIEADTYTDRGGESTTEKATTSQQHDTDDPHERTEYYDPPYPPTNLSLLKERSETHATCVGAKAQGVAGHGFDTVPHPEVEADDPPGQEAVRDFWFGSDSTWQLGPDKQPATPSEVLENAWDDYEGIGWLAVEVLLNDQSATPTGLAHIPAHTIRARKDAPGFVQIDPDTSLIEGYFAPAGARFGDDKTFIDADDGTVADSIRGVDTPANELLVIRNYSALAPHYGIPDIVPAMQTLFGDLAARKFNARFFENDGVPRFAVIVEGGQLTEDAWTELEEKFKQLRLDENDHRGVILEAVSGVTSSFEDAHNVSLRIEPLTVGVEEDASFIEYRKENEHDIGKAHDCPPVVYYRTDQINYANAQAQRRTFANEVIRPKQEKLASRLYRVIHQTMLDVDGWTVEFVLHGAENEERQAQIAKTRVTAGVQGGMTVNEGREELGLGPLDGPEGELLLSELGGSGSAAAIENALAAERDDAQREQRAADLGYSITERADADD